jgi:hypothetical protein
MHTITITEPYNDLDLKVSYFYDRGTSGTYDTPGTPEAADIKKVEYNGHDITAFAFALYTEEYLEERILELTNNFGGYDED